jgi:hypothetical protein
LVKISETLLAKYSGSKIWRGRLQMKYKILDVLTFYRQSIGLAATSPHCWTLTPRILACLGI